MHSLRACTSQAADEAGRRNLAPGTRFPRSGISAPGALSPRHPTRAFFGAPTLIAVSGCHPDGNDQHLSPSGFCPVSRARVAMGTALPAISYFGVSHRLVGCSLHRPPEGNKKCRRSSWGELPNPPTFLLTLSRLCSRVCPSFKARGLVFGGISLKNARL